MKVYFNFNIHPFCAMCLDVMNYDRDINDRDENGIIKSYAVCVNPKCEQFNKRFLVPPLSAEIEEVK